MTPSDLTLRRPIATLVLTALAVIFGIVSFIRLPLREFPDIDPPIISIETNYRGASAAIVESQITQRIEDRVGGIEGIRSIES